MGMAKRGSALRSGDNEKRGRGQRSAINQRGWWCDGGKKAVWGAVQRGVMCRECGDSVAGADRAGQAGWLHQMMPPRVT
jgi:hypothetical protein